MPALPQLYPYKAGAIEPIVLPGEIVGIWVNKQYTFSRIKFVEGVMRSDPIEFDFGIVNAGAVTAITQMTLLEMPDDEFGQFRCIAMDDLSFILYQGRADQRHKLNNRVATYTRFGELTDPSGHTGEFYVYEDNWAFMSATNQTDYDVTVARVAFYGYRYVVDLLPEFSAKNPPREWTRVPATAHL